MATLGWRANTNHINLTLSSSDEDEQPRFPSRNAHRPQVERLAGSGGGRRLKRAPRIVDSEEEEEQNGGEDDELKRAVQLSLKKRSDLEEEDELDEGDSRGSCIVRDDAASAQSASEDGDSSTEEEPDTEDEEGEGLNDEEDELAPLDDMRRPAQQAVRPAQMTVEEQLRKYVFVKGLERPPATTERKVSAKERAFEQMREDQKRLGVPIDVPKNAHHSAKEAEDSDPLAAIDDERALASAMQDLDVNDDASPKDQESALKELVSSTIDMDNVDTSSGPPAGLKCTLLPHQVQGLHWLKDRESGKKRGGILADDMGLGKTVQLISLLLANPSDREKCKSKTTLVVCPVALMGQWKQEIESKTDGRLRVLIHHGPSRTDEGRKLQKYHVVITSYNTLSSEWVDPKPRQKKGGYGFSDEEDELDELGKLSAKLSKKGGKVKDDKGPLFDDDYMFYRVILDEAHQIKNTNTKVNKACCDLKAHYRWCLTGTPLQNDVMDLYAIFKFLGGRIVRPLHDVSEFKAKIAKPLKSKRTKTALARLQIVLKAIMLRRTKTMTVDGKPLLTLPKREVVVVKGPFLDQKEADFYKKIEEKMQEALSEMATSEIMKDMTKVLVRLLRMRQACNHPSLVTKNSIEDQRDALDPTPQRARTTPTGSGEPSPSASHADGLADLLDGMSLNTCALCSAAASTNDSGYCKSCDRDMERYASLSSSTKIKRTLHILEGIKRESYEAIEAEEQSEEDEQDSDDFELGIVEVPKKPKLGMKKTIIFSQFTSMFDILEPFLRKGGYRYVRFDGQLNAKEKEAALDAIRNNPNITVILVSIKCGAVGLNLTCCSRVVLLDLWWNPAIEEQAFDRAHRFGQKDDVKIYKLTIDDTVEERILKLQADKAELAHAALDGGDLSKGNKLSVQEILSLFKLDKLD
ncbi:DNA repair protein rad5 [Rhodotorula toruloides ATCC 204091]|uniref:BY PROTMAP: gi/342319357/gb/EGU11306.1/ DNA repair protein rad5 [Rhodotorula glutinis ATCC 204091] n=1 Tax=Rhodotorula toruloides TaxID=5286 RepID=A0A0K3C4A4_RHOTO|nr:DNA repair protein rad5 [Rhodotorula toruloides ATCC 204091]